MNMLSPQELTREQKIGFVLLLVFGFVTIGLGFVQFRQTIYSSLYVNALDKSETGQVRTFFSEDAKLQQIDTDQDGINDYEELSFYETSPYLPDTDSDGINDKTEIDNGTDPLCAVGKVCASNQAETAPSPDTDGSLSPIAQPETPLDVLSNELNAQSTASGAFDINTLLTDPTAIRKLLLESGQMTSEQLSAIDDVTLLQVMSEFAQQQTTQTNTP